MGRDDASDVNHILFLSLLRVEFGGSITRAIAIGGDPLLEWEHAGQLMPEVSTEPWLGVEG